GNIDSYHFLGYLGGQVGAFALRGGAGWTWSNVDTTRTIAFPGFREQARANYDGSTGQVFGELALPLHGGATAWEPFARLAYVHIDIDGFTERGGAAALTSSGDSNDVGYSDLGVRVATTTRFAGIVLTPHASVAWQHAIGDIDTDKTLAFASGSSSFDVL